MNRSGLGFGALALGLLLSATLVACGGGNGKTGGKTDDAGGGGLGDGFIASGCQTVEDCVPNKCQTAKCNAATKMCQYTDRTCASDTSCPAETACSKSVCNPDDGTWTPTPTNEMMACTTTSKDPGTCTSGSCAAVPTCYASSSFKSVSCDSGSSSVNTDTNDPSMSSAKAAVSSYTCAPNELGPEVGYKIYTNPSTLPDNDVTVTLKLTDASGVVLADQTGVDLDLIILTDTCASTSTCANPAAGTAFQGITTGTSAERVVFHADHSKTYYAVVDGKDLNQVGNYVIEVESCGQCTATTPAQTLSCNMTMPVSASTATGTKRLTNYMCADSTNPVLAGNEIPFLFKDDSGTSHTVKATLTSASQPATLLAVSQNYYGECDPTDCIASSVTTNNTATVSFSSGSTFSFTRNWIIVDTQNTTDSMFGLQVDCPPPIVVPSTWKCSSTYYGAGDGCDCGCGAVDPDCADAKATSCKYCAESGSCYTSTSISDCPGKINPTNNGICTP